MSHDQTKSKTTIDAEWLARAAKGSLNLPDGMGDLPPAGRPPARRTTRRRVKAWLFALVRPLFVRNVDPNEDYVCEVCGEPVLRRFLTCSDACGKRFDKMEAEP